MNTTIKALADLIGSIAWPASALIIFFFLRKEVSALIKRVASLKVKDVEMNFLHEATQLRRAAQTVLPALQDETERDQLFHKFMEIARNNPKEAVLDSWSRFISLIQDFAAGAGFPRERGMTAGEIVMELKLRNLFEGRIFTLIENASKLGFQVHHADCQPSYAEAIEFCDAVSQLIVFFDSINQKKRDVSKND